MKNECLFRKKSIIARKILNKFLDKNGYSSYKEIFNLVNNVFRNRKFSMLFLENGLKNGEIFEKKNEGFGLV